MAMPIQFEKQNLIYKGMVKLAERIIELEKKNETLAGD